MGRLDDARRRRDRTAAAAAANAPTPVSDLIAQEVAQLHPLINGTAKAIHRRQPAQTHRKRFARERQQQFDQACERKGVLAAAFGWGSFTSHHQLNNIITVTIAGNRHVMVVAREAGVELQLYLTSSRWEVALWVDTASERSTGPRRRLILSNEPSEDMVPNYSRFRSARPRVLSAVEELSTAILDYYGIPYSEIES